MRFKVLGTVSLALAFVVFISPEPTLTAGTIFKYRNDSGYIVFTDRELTPEQLAKDNLRLYGTDTSRPARSEPETTPAPETASPTPSAQPKAPAPPETKTEALLELLSWAARGEKGNLIAEGEVKNIAGRSLPGVEAAVSFATAAGEVISSNSSPVDFDPLQPGQITSFKVICPGKPGAQKASVVFKFSSGAAIACTPEERRHLSLSLPEVQPPQQPGSGQGTDAAAATETTPQKTRRPPRPPQGTESPPESGTPSR